MSAIKDILDKIDKLSPADQERLKTILFSKTFTKSISIEEFVTKERFANGRVCPVCGATHVVRNGKRKDGTQKYICKDCGKLFVITTNSIVSGTRKDLNVWIKYVDCMLNGFSVRKTAEECGIHRNTAFAWRHKILVPFKTWPTMLSLMALLKLMKPFSPYLIKATIKRARSLQCPANLTKEATQRMYVVCRARRFAYLVR